MPKAGAPAPKVATAAPKVAAPKVASASSFADAVVQALRAAGGALASSQLYARVPPALLPPASVAGGFRASVLKVPGVTATMVGDATTFVLHEAPPPPAVDLDEVQGDFCASVDRALRAAGRPLTLSELHGVLAPDARDCFDAVALGELLREAMPTLEWGVDPREGVECVWLYPITTTPQRPPPAAASAPPLRAAAAPAAQAQALPGTFPWDCAMCTFANAAGMVVCEMCSSPCDGRGLAPPPSSASRSSAAASGGSAAASAGSAAAFRGSAAASGFSAAPSGVGSAAASGGSAAAAAHAAQRSSDDSDGEGGWVEAGGGAARDRRGSFSSAAASAAGGGAGDGSGESAAAAAPAAPPTAEDAERAVLAASSLSLRLYVKGFPEDTTEAELKAHVNAAFCRAYRWGEYVSGVVPLGAAAAAVRPGGRLGSAAAHVVFASEMYATAALQLDTHLLLRGQRLSLKRPQGFTAAGGGAASLRPLELRPVREEEGVTLPPVEPEALPPVNAFRSRPPPSAAAGALRAAAAMAAARAAPAAPMPAAAGTGRKAKKKAKGEDAVELSDADKELVARILTHLRRDALECFRLICRHDHSELSIFFGPLCEALESLQREGILKVVINDNTALVFSGKAGDVPHNILKPRKKTDPVMLNSIAFLRRYLADAQFPVAAFQ